MDLMNGTCLYNETRVLERVCKQKCYYEIINNIQYGSRKNIVLGLPITQERMKEIVILQLVFQL